MKPIGILLTGLWFSLAAAADTTVPRTVVVDQDRLAALPEVTLSANFVDRVIHDLSVDQHLQILENMDPDKLKAALDSQHKQLAFWINIYNGYTQYFLKTDPSLYQKDRSEFFKKEQIPVAGYKVSMEDIEHGVLRRGAVVYSLGFIRTLSFRKEFIRRFAADEVDYRIHFALNCGAKSCPPVVAYQTDLVNRQLNDNSRYYLTKEVKYDPEKNVVQVPALMNWFKADFGSADDQRAILKAHGALPVDAEPAIEFLPYDWTMQIENYRAYSYR